MKLIYTVEVELEDDADAKVIKSIDTELTSKFTQIPLNQDGVKDVEVTVTRKRGEP